MTIDARPFHTIDIDSKWIYTDPEKRLDAGFYAEDVIAARLLIGNLPSKLSRVEPLSDLALKISWPGRFRRRYTSSEDGSPFLMPSEVFTFSPQASKYIKAYPREVFVKEGWLLITRSGSVGRCLISTELLEKFVLSDDLIRVVVKDGVDIGYISAYLQTWIGQAFLVKDKYGMTVKHLEPSHIGNIPIPRIPSLESQVAEKMRRVRQLRNLGQNQLSQAQHLLVSELGMTTIDAANVSYFGATGHKDAKCFEVESHRLTSRMDARYFSPLTQAVTRSLRRSRFPVIQFGEVIEDVFIPGRFKRSYVEDKRIGIPFLQGSHIPDLKPLDVKYLWKDMKNIGETLLRKNWVLLTRSGTVGRVGIVRDGWNGWAASEHIFRIKVKGGVHPGYVVAILSSPYCQRQIEAKSYGAVVDEIGEQDTTLVKEVEIVLPDEDIQKEIGDLVFNAFDNRDEANRIEDEAIETIESKLSGYSPDMGHRLSDRMS